MRLRRNWQSGLVLAAVVGFGLSMARRILGPGRPDMGVDAAFFQHAGWYVTEGAVPYVDIWDTKPPLTIETATVLALLSSGDMYVMHIFSTTVTVAAGVGSVYIIALLIHRVTANDLASFTGGLSILTLVGFHWLAAGGFRARFLAMFFGLLGILLQLRDSPFLAGVATAMGAGFVQHAIVFPILVFGLAIQERSLSRVTATTLGMLSAATAAILPIVLAGAFVPMIVEVVLAPVIASENRTLTSTLARSASVFLVLGYSSVSVLLGWYGILRYSLVDLRRTWWILVGGVVYAIQILLVDFDGSEDLLFCMLFVSLGVGLLVDLVDRRAGEAITIIVAAIVLVSTVLLGGTGIVSTSIDVDSEDTLLQSSIQSVKSFFGLGYQGTYSGLDDSIIDESPYGRSEIERIYWNKAKPKSCHYRLAGDERLFIKRTGRDIMAEKCGHLP